MRDIYKTPPMKEKKRIPNTDKNVEASKNVKATAMASIDKIIKDLETEKTSEVIVKVTKAIEPKKVGMTTSSLQETEAWERPPSTSDT